MIIYLVMGSFVRITPLTVMSDCYGNNLGGTAEVKPFRPNGREGFFIYDVGGI